MLTIGAWLLLGFAAQAAGLVTTFVANPLTGVALDGYDPVSYFTAPAPVPGLADYEYDWGGVPWYFASAANRDVFMRNPDVYAPQFGGHCATSLARGFLSDGKPRLYAVEGLKLYLFYSTANRDAFMLSKYAAIASANDKWPTLSAELIGPKVQIATAETPSAVSAADTAAPSASTVPPIPGVDSNNAVVNAVETAQTPSIAPDGASSHVETH